MRKLSQVFSSLFLLLVFIGSISFSYLNTTEISITLGNRVLAPLPVSVWIIGAFVSGGVIGLVLGLSLFRQLRARHEIRRLKKKLADSRQESQQLRAMTLKDLE